MQYRTLGSRKASLRVSALGLGCMGMSAFYGETNEEESIATGWFNLDGQRPGMPLNVHIDTHSSQFRQI